MQLTLTIPEDIAATLEDRARRSGETPEEEAAHLLRASLAPPRDTFSLEIPERWAGLTPSQMLDEMDIELRETEQDAMIHSADGDFARFPGLRWINPLLS